MYDGVKLCDRFRLPRKSLINLTNKLKGELEHVTDRQRDDDFGRNTWFGVFI